MSATKVTYFTYLASRTVGIS